MCLGQLIRVNDPHENATWVYNYDHGGNITSKVRYAYTTGALGTAVETIPYAYGDANWKDKLTAYNGTAITYDAIGNPLNDGSWTYEWAVGRQLKKMSREGQSLTFKYDHNGMRIQKILEHSWYPETTNYTYHGKLLTHMEVNYTDFDEVEHTDNLHFFYDAYSHPAKVRFNDELYTYLGNTKNDIVGILDSTGNLVVEYKYDAWGRLINTTGSLTETLGKRNPFRYRCYIYDPETECYWLKARYYDPEIGRFFNADSVCAETGVLGSSNRYAYCRNAPIILEDDSGNWPSLSNVLQGIAIVAAAVAVVAVTVATCGVAAPVLAGIGVVEATTIATSAAIVAEAALETTLVATAAAVAAEAYENQPREYTVYCLSDPHTKKWCMWDEQKNYEKRMQAHKAPYSRTYGLIPTVRIDNLTYAEARGLEEAGMAYYHTLNYLDEGGKNLIRAISPRNKNAPIYREAASRKCTYLYNRLSNTYLCWLEEQ